MSGAFGLHSCHARTPEVRRLDGRLRTGAYGSGVSYSSANANCHGFQTGSTCKRGLSITASVVSEDKGAILTDAAVPEGHRDLHGFLYGEGGAEVHNLASSDRFDPIPVWHGYPLSVNVGSVPPVA